MAAFFTLFFILACFRTAFPEESKPIDKDLAIEEVRAVVGVFLFWTDPEVYERKDYKAFSKGAEPEFGASVESLKILFSDNSEVASKEAGEKEWRLDSPEEFAKQLERMRFAFLARRRLTEGPVYEKKREQIEVRFKTSLQSDDKAPQTYGYRLMLGKVGEDWKIGEARIEALASEADRPLQESPTRRQLGVAYNPRSGLGMRYLGGGAFEFSDLAFSPDGSKLAFTSLAFASSEICVLDLKTGSSTRITDTPYWEGRPCFTEDGNSVIFLSDQDDDGGGIFCANLAEGPRKAPVAVAPEIRRPFAVAVAPAGGHLACLVMKERLGFAYVMKADGTKVCRLKTHMPHAAEIRFSSDGTRLLIRSSPEIPCAQSDGLSTFESFEFSADKATEGKTILTAHLQSELLGLVVGQEERLVYKTIRENGKPVIYARKLTEKTEGELVRFYDQWPSGAKLTPDGKYLLFVGSGDLEFEYYLYSSALTQGAQPVRLTQESGYISGLAIAPDGKKTAFLWEPKGAPGRGKGTIMLVDLETKKLQTLKENH